MSHPVSFFSPSSKTIDSFTPVFPEDRICIDPLPSRFQPASDQQSLRSIEQRSYDPPRKDWSARLRNAVKEGLDYTVGVVDGLNPVTEVIDTFMNSVGYEIPAEGIATSAPRRCVSQSRRKLPTSQSEKPTVCQVRERNITSGITFITKLR